MQSGFKNSAPVVIIGLAFSLVSVGTTIPGISDLAGFLHNITGLEWQWWNIVGLAIGLSMIAWGLFIKKSQTVEAQIEGQEISDSRSKDRILRIVFAPVIWCIDRCRQFIDWANSDSGNKSFNILKTIIFIVVLFGLGMPLILIVAFLAFGPAFLLLDWLEHLNF